jgi:hypothetical protein
MKKMQPKGGEKAQGLIVSPINQKPAGKDAGKNKTELKFKEE